MSFTVIDGCEIDYHQLNDYPSEAAIEMLQKVAYLGHRCCRDHTQITKENLFPIEELDEKSLGYSHIHCTPTFHVQAQLPYLGEDGLPIGGFGFTYCSVNIYEDGTAIAIDRRWAYEKMSIDGKPNKKDQPQNLNSNFMTVKFYLLGCKHVYNPMSQEDQEKRGIRGLFRTEHAYLCEKCGHHYVVDSSD